MSQKGIEQLIGKALADKKFMEEVLKDPEAKIRQEGLDVSPEEIAQIKKIDSTKARQFAESFAQEFLNRKQGIGIPFL